MPTERNRAAAFRVIRTEIKRLTLEAKQQPVLIVDEAHHLRNEVLEDLRLLDERLGKLPEVSVGAISHPSSNLADFYREMGDLFAVELKPHNRWGGFKALRERWLAHLEATLLRPVVLIDEALRALLDMLYEVASALENHYAAQLRRYHGDLFADFDDDLPEF